MTLTPSTWLLALLPILCVLFLMLVFKWGGSRAGAFGWFASLLIAFFAFGTSWQVLAYTLAKSVLLSLDVLYIIWSALLLFNIANQAGAIQIIGERLPTLTEDRVMQTLLVSWLLVSFLQGMGGFGVPIAICAPILVGMGYNPILAVVMSAIGHSWAVNFGSLATAFQALMAVTGLPGEVLAPLSALLLGIASFPCGAIVAWLGCGWKGLKRALPSLLFLSIIMGGTQYLLAVNGLWTLAATGGAMAGLLSSLILLGFKTNKRKNQLPEKPAITQNENGNEKPKSIILSMSAYIILVVLGFTVMLIPQVNEFLGKVRLSLNFPDLTTAYGWQTPAGPSRKINLFGHPGAILLYTSVIAFTIYRLTGYLKPGSHKPIIKGVLKSGVNASLGVLAMVSLATIMMHSGMTNLLARGLSESFNRNVYPAIAPFIGALGAFITGSNNNSNVLFGVLQMDTASLLNLSVPLILAAQTAGGSLGSVMSPAKVIVGCSTVGLTNKEGLALRKIILYGLIPLSLVAVIATLLALG